MMDTMPPTEPTPPQQTPPTPPQPGHRPAWAQQGPPAWWTQQPRRSSWLGRIFLAVVILGVVGSVVLGIGAMVVVGSNAAGGLVTSNIRAGQTDQTIAVYDVAGVIDGESAGRFNQFYDQVVGDNDVKAVVLRIDSPGGGITPSDQISSQVEALRQAGKIVVVSMGALAASGGYYISAPADHIIAEPTTITGSIGVIAAWPVLKGTLEKIGAEMVVIKSTNASGWKDEMSSFRTPDEREREHLQEVLDQMQARFEKVVRQGRPGLVTREVKYSVRNAAGQEVERTETEPLNGKIYLAEEALELKLIDDIGYLADALDAAESMANLSKPRIVRFHRRKGLMEQMLEGRSDAGSLRLDAHMLDTLQTPRIMMIWKAQ